MFAHQKASLEKIRIRLEAVLPGNFASLCAFGSRARGNHGVNSDFDILVLVRNRTPTIETEIMSIFVDEEEKSGISFDPVIKTLASFDLEKEHRTPFFESIVRDGVTV